MDQYRRAEQKMQEKEEKKKKKEAMQLCISCHPHEPPSFLKDAFLLIQYMNSLSLPLALCVCVCLFCEPKTIYIITWTHASVM